MASSKEYLAFISEQLSELDDNSYRGTMLKDYEIDKPILETDRLIIRVLNESDVDDLKEWLGRDEIYTYWGITTIISTDCLEKII